MYVCMHACNLSLHRHSLEKAPVVEYRYVCVSVFVCIHKFVCMYMHACMHVCNVSIRRVLVREFNCYCIYVCVYVYMYIYMYS
jgi:hypothetical protein